MERTAPPPTRTTAYGSDPAQLYDVRLPAGPGADVTVVVVHGGFWRERFDRSHAGCQAQAFADAGYPVAVLEYRRTGMPGGGWPGTTEDVAAGVAAVLGDPGLPERAVLVGHSAGGHLVVWAASQPGVAGWWAWSALRACSTSTRPTSSTWGTVPSPPSWAARPSSCRTRTPPLTPARSRRGRRSHRPRPR